MPENLFVNGECIYCTNIHDETTDGGHRNKFQGKTYHADNTPLIHESNLICNKEKTVYAYPHESMMTKCSHDDSEPHFYSVLDRPRTLVNGERRGYGNWAPLCWNHRGSIQKNKDSAPTRKCLECKKQFVYGDQNNSWTCANCYFKDDLSRKTISTGEINISIFDLISYSDDVLTYFH